MKKKIYKLKKWLTLEETAKCLSTELEDEITIADVLQLAIDKELRISVNFPHDWKGKICDVTTNTEKVNQYKEVTGLDGKPFKLYEYEKCSETEYIKILPEIYDFKAGVYELKLIGQERLDLEFQMKLENDLPTVDVINLSGFYITDKNGITIERQTHFKQKKQLNDEQKATLYHLNKALKAIDDNVSLEEFNKIIDESEKPLPIEPFYYPCASISEIEGAFFVVQTNHINEFLAELEDDEPSKLSLDNSLYLIAEMLRATKSKSKKWTQSTIIDEILSQRQQNNEQINGLEKRTIEEYFATANKKLKSN